MAEGYGRRINTLIATFYVFAAASSLTLGLAPLLKIRCDACSGGLLSLSMPWIGVAFYSSLAFIAARFPGSPLLSLAPGFFVFVHASLVVEMFLTGRPCWGCFLVAVLGIGGALGQVRRNPREWRAAAFALVLGGVAGFFTPFERTDELVTLRLWPARLLEAAPAWVPRDELARCEHSPTLRIRLYEKDCKS